MDPADPLDAQQIVVEYARILERDLEQNRHPGRIDSLPYARPIIKDAIRTSVKNLAASGRLSDDLREYLETAYTSLADYLDPELADLLIEYRKSADQLAAEPHASHERTQSPAWRTLVEGGALAGEVARATTREADELRKEFRGLLSSVFRPPPRSRLIRRSAHLVDVLDGPLLAGGDDESLLVLGLGNLRDEFHGGATLG